MSPVVRISCLLVAVVSVALTSTSLNAADNDAKKPKKSKSIKVSVLIRGANNDESVDVLRKALSAVKGIRFKPDEIVKGKRPKYFTEPFVVEVLEPKVNSIGELAKAVGEAKTPHREDLPPKLNLVLYTPDPIDEPSVMNLRSELMNVNGTEPLENGGLGGFPRRGFYWLQLETAGGAALKDVLDGCRRARVTVTTTKPKDGQD